MKKVTIKDKIMLAIPIYGLVYRYNHLYNFLVPNWWEIYQVIISPVLLGWLFLKFIGYNIFF